MFVGLSAIGYFGAVWIVLAAAISLATRRNVGFPVLLTASRASREGAQAFIGKPFDPQALIESTKQLLRRR